MELETLSKEQFDKRVAEFNDFLEDTFPGKTKVQGDDEDGVLFLVCPDIRTTLGYLFYWPGNIRPDDIGIWIERPVYDSDSGRYFLDRNTVYSGRVHEHFVTFFSSNWRNFK